MVKTKLYIYLGTNGTIESPVHLEDIYYTTRYRLIADNGKTLTKDNKRYASSTVVPEKEVSLWYEVDEELVKGQK